MVDFVDTQSINKARLQGVVKMLCSFRNRRNYNKENFMPHCILEYSDNVTEAYEILEALAELHNELEKTGLFNIEDVKSRAQYYDDCYIGDGNPDNAFIHLKVSILKGRPVEVRQHLSNHLLEFLKVHFSASLSELNCQISVEISEMDSETYTKTSSQNGTP
jgi:5-carboxymethyl-2-hydroxymuconate isomerase